MDRHADVTDELLLDFHLDRVTEEQREWLRGELDRDRSLNMRSQRLARILAPLDLWSTTPSAGDLADRVLNFIHSQNAVAESAPRGAANRPVIVGGSWFRFREMIAAAACVALLVGVVVPGLSNVRDRSRQVQCASNLGMLFGATGAYQQVFADSLPYAGFVPDSAWLASGATGRAYASNSRHLFVLLRAALGAQPVHFICPADDHATPMPRGDLEAYDDFASACNVSYNSLNLSAAHPNLRPRPIVAYLGDPNPLFERAQFKAGVNPDTTNSPAHGGRGQTVLTLDGSARWMTTPIYGPAHDNLWLAGDIRTYTGCEAPTSDDDTQLIPGYPARECVGDLDMKR